MSFLSAALGMDKNDAGDPFRARQIDLINSSLSTGLPYYGHIASSQGGLYDTFLPQYQQAVQNEGDYLSRNTTDAQRAQYIANATQNVASNLQAGLSNATTALAARGLGDSGTMAGVVGNAYTNQAGAVSSAANNADAYFTNLRQQNLARLSQLYGGTSQQALQNGMGATGAQVGLSQWGAGQEGDLAQQAYALQAQRQAAMQGAFGDLIGTGAELYAASQGVPVSPGGGRTAGGTDYAPYPTDGTHLGMGGDGNWYSYAPGYNPPGSSSPSSSSWLNDTLFGPSIPITGSPWSY